jgi:hypothetical protein
MGVRFPLQQQRPDFGQMQQADNARQVAPQQQEVQPPGQAVMGQTQEPAEENAIREAQTPQALVRQTPAERAADDAGAQTPGSIIDMLA